MFTTREEFYRFYYGDNRMSYPKHEVHKPTPGVKPPPDRSNIRRVIIRAPNGCAFSFWGADMYLEYPTGKEDEIIDHLRKWLDTYVVPVTEFYKQQDKEKENAEEQQT